MPDIQPFRGLRYRVPNAELNKVLCPPYDVISPAYRDELYARDPRNIVRVELSRSQGEGAYEEAGATLRGWIAAGLLAPDPEPSLYLLEQRFEVEGRAFTRLGVLARMRVEQGTPSRILPHEHTRKEAREDRYNLLKATRANLSSIFLMFSDRQGAFGRAVERVTTRPADFEYTDDGGVAHRVWRIHDGATIALLQSAIGAEKAYIADGHHRYATAQRYHQEMGSEAAWTLGYFTPMESPGLVILPYHRLLDRGPSLEEARRKLEGAFNIESVPDAAAAAHTAAQSTMPYAFGLAEPGAGALVAEARPEAEDLLGPESPPSLCALDTYFLHQGVLPKLLGVGDDAVRYAHSLAEVVAAVREGQCRLAVLLRPTPAQQIVAVADARENMPAKSTFFHPKLPSGLVVHPLHG